MEITLVPGFDRPQQVRELFGEYARLIISSDSRYREYLSIQGFEAELEDCRQKYGPPGGRLYLAYWKDKLAGCVALRQIDDTRCEIKRLYVRMVFRGCGIGGMLVDQVIADACQEGYRHILLDTYPFLKRAIAMYRKRGFYEIEKYLESPIETTIYMQKDL